jgi:hypothetical protein
LTQWQAFWPTSLAAVNGNIAFAVWEDTRSGWGAHGGLGVLSPQPAGTKGFAAQSAGVGTGQWAVALSPARAAKPARSVAERLIQADILLPVVATGADRVAAALDAIGLTVGEQETIFTTLLSGADNDLVPSPAAKQRTHTGRLSYPVYTSITDVLDWARSLADQPSLDLLRNAGALGINLLCDQADALVWLTLALMDPKAQSPLIAELSDTQVQLELLSLTRDLSALAALAY